MKPKACDKYKDTIEQYVCGELDTPESESLFEHVQQCDGCKDCLAELQQQEAMVAQWAQSLEPLMKAGHERAVEQLHLMPEPVGRRGGAAGSWQKYIGYAAAACILIVTGFLAGQGMRPALDMEAIQQQWMATVQPQIEATITSSVVETLRPEIVTEYAAMQDALSDQLNVQLTAYAEQTVMRNDLQTYRLLTELIDAIKSAQVQNQQWALTAMAELESQRLQDQQAVRDQVAVLAAYTGNKLFQAEKAIEALSVEKN